MRKSNCFLGALMALCLVLGLPSGASAAELPFTDVPDAAWYSSAVRYVYTHGMMGGSGSADIFAPDSPTSRGMLATILHRMEGLPSASGAAFEDVLSGQWYTDAVVWASANGIIAGYGNGNFGPDDPITWEQMMSILYRYARYKGYPVTISGDAGSDTVADPYGKPLGGYHDAALEDAHFKRPWAIAPFLGDCAVSDADNNVVRLLLEKTTQTVNGVTEEDLTVTDLGVIFNHPTGLAADEAGNLYVSDTYEGAVRKIHDGVVTTLVRRDESDLDAFIPTSPVGLMLHDGRLYVCDSFARKVFVISREQ